MNRAALGDGDIHKLARGAIDWAIPRTSANAEVCADADEQAVHRAIAMLRRSVPASLAAISGPLGYRVAQAFQPGKGGVFDDGFGEVADHRC